MIKLTKTECPDVLRQNKNRWTTELMSYLNEEGDFPESVKTRYNNPHIKSAVKSETHDKCAYCECHPEPAYPGDIEHIKPKSKYPHLTFEWENLTYVCFWCNNNKRDKYDENCPPVNPYDDDPGDFFFASRAYIRPKRGNERARRTDDYLKLNRPELLTDRRRRLNYLESHLFDRYTAEIDGKKRKALLSQIKIEIAEDKKYSFCMKAAFKEAASLSQLSDEIC